jgi:nitrate/nitrite transport system permease protein
MKSFKNGLLKVIDVSGLTFLSPIVRLIYGEEPSKQLKDIFAYIVIPTVTFLLFVMVWAIVAPQHKTKSGEVPTPLVTWEATKSIVTFHERETMKEKAYVETGADRAAHLSQVQTRLQQLDQLEADAQVALKDAQDINDKAIAHRASEFVTMYEQRKSEFDANNLKNRTLIEQFAQSLKLDDIKGKEKLLAAIREQNQMEAAQRDALAEIKAKEVQARAYKDPVFRKVLLAKDALAEERQYLVNMEQQLTRTNRDVQTQAMLNRLNDLKQSYVSTTNGPELVKLGQQILSTEDSVIKKSESEYAKPWTLPLQIVRSVVCVFAGFLLGTIIAVPLGIVCGLSPIFMAAMTPFIALFKPVSPIVWLPIALITVGGFIPDPDKHWLIVGMANLPFVGWMKVNPAFIASAITVALCSLWATLVNTALGVASIDKDHMNVARVLRLGPWSRLTKIVIPSALPLIFAGLRISLGVGWMVLIAAELLSSSEGIGKYVWDQFNNGASDSFAKMFVVVFVVGIIGLMLDRIMIVLQRLVSYDTAASAL